MAPKKDDFTVQLLNWHNGKNSRTMPWKGEKDPYRIWLSEIILQQTRVDQGWSYYEKFITAFPTIHDLANAPEQQVFKLWEGLGYYSRCRNLIATAKKIDTEYKGEFPSTYHEILGLKGIGPYTASAISSFAFRLPHAVVDGNVTRVLSRYFGERTPIDSTAGKKLFAKLADGLLDREQPDIYNQAIMDFGATVCLPRNPQCTDCVQRSTCQAWLKGLTSELPVKEKAIRKRTRWFYYFIAETADDQLYIRQRTGKDIWEGLYEFILWETDQPVYGDLLVRSDFAGQTFGVKSNTLTIRHISRVYRQELSHQTIQGQFVTLRLKKKLPTREGWLLVDRQRLTDYPFPKFINAWLQDPTPAQSLF
ncbi:MAG: A/G-specific adenine glycosylase [Bacteroidetes bacterium]|nr:A/G-specific adenine glycosylase [Bacteroidota bacterium]